LDAKAGQDKLLHVVDLVDLKQILLNLKAMRTYGRAIKL